MKTLDYPAAHSMDTEWFAIDDAGQVALMKTGQEGPMPLNLMKKDNVWSLMSRLEKDKDGYPILPIQYDPFADGDDSAELQLVFASMSEQEQARLQEWASYSLSEMWPEETPPFPNEEKYHGCAVIARLENAADLDYFYIGDRDNTKKEEVVRLSLEQHLYYIDMCSYFAGIMILWLTKRLHAIRIIPYREQALFNLGAIHGFYEYDADCCHDLPPFPKLCPNIWFPVQYRRENLPTQPRQGMPASILEARTEQKFGDIIEVGPFIVHLQGIQFADVEKVQLDDSVACYSWDIHRVSHSKSSIRRNLYIAYEAPNEERASAIEQWRSAALQGDFLAQYTLGYWYCENEEPDFAEALYWMEMAARQAETNNIASEDIYENGVVAQYCAGQLLFRKWWKAVTFDQEEVTRMQHWFELAAKRDYGDAQSRLGWMYMKGELLAQDLPQAKYWLQRFAVHDRSNAERFLNELATIELAKGELAKIEASANSTQNE